MNGSSMFKLQGSKFVVAPASRGLFRASRPKPFAKDRTDVRLVRSDCVHVAAIRRDAELNPPEAGATTNFEP